MAEPDPPDPEAEAAVDAIIAEFNGNARAAIKALLHDLDVLARDSENVSRGFVRRARVVEMATRRRLVP